jgi:hypothetical protein
VAIAVPTSLPSTSQWQVSDYLDLRLFTGPAAGGVATVESRQLGNDERWLIARAVVGCSSLTRTTLRLYESTADPGRYLSGSNTGNFDEADYPGATGLQVPPSTSLVAVWTGASDGARGTLAVQGLILRRS